MTKIIKKMIVIGSLIGVLGGITYLLSKNIKTTPDTITESGVVEFHYQGEILNAKLSDIIVISEANTKEILAILSDKGEFNFKALTPSTKVIIVKNNSEEYKSIIYSQYDYKISLSDEVQPN